MQKVTSRFLPWMINLTEERGPSHDIRTRKDFALTGVFLGMHLRLFRVNGLKKKDFWDNSVGSCGLEEKEEGAGEDEGEGVKESFNEAKRVAIVTEECSSCMKNKEGR